MNVYDACEQAYKNGYAAGLAANQCVVCGAAMPEGGHVCAKCAAGAELTTSSQPMKKFEPPKPNTELSFGANDGRYDFLISYRRAKPLN